MDELYMEWFRHGPLGMPRTVAVSREDAPEVAAYFRKGYEGHPFVAETDFGTVTFSPSYFIVRGTFALGDDKE